MAWTEKKYARINWRNRPSTATALGATNLNHMDVFLNEVDNALIVMETDKLNIATANSMIASLEINTDTGLITAKQLDGTTFTWDLNLEKIPVSFSLSENGILTMTTDDGTEWTANVADLIKDYVFDDSDTIAFSKEFVTSETDTKGTYHVEAVVKDGSIKSKHLDPDYRADVQQYMNTAQTAANDSLQYSKDSKRWAVGDAEYEGSTTDNSKYYKEQAELAKAAAEQARDEAQGATGVVVMAPGILGIGKPDNVTVKVSDDGTISVPTAGEEKLGVVKPDGVSTYVNDDGEMIALSGTPDFYGAYEDFPIPGTPGRMYIDDTVEPRLIFTWDAEAEDYVITGGQGGADGSSADIPVTIPASGWTGEAAPYSQTITVPQLRDGMTPIHFLSGATDAERYAYSLLTDYTVGNAQITFYAADLPAVDIHLVLKGVPAQQLEVVDNTVLVPVQAIGFTLNTETERYEKTITVDGMTAGLGGWYDILRSGPVLTQEESEIMCNITDIQRQEGAIKIVCLEAPAQDYTLVLYGTYKEAAEGDVVLSGIPGLLGRVEALEQGKINLTPVNIANDFTSTGNFEYTGITLEIPANSYYCLTARFGWNSSRPKRCAICSNGAQSATGILSDNASESDVVSTTACGYTESVLNIGIWAQYTSSGSERAILRGFYIKGGQ